MTTSDGLRVTHQGLIDATSGVLYSNDRTIQCVTSRRVEYSRHSGCYFVRARSVYPWSADGIADGGHPPNIVSMDSVRPRSKDLNASPARELNWRLTAAAKVSQADPACGSLSQLPVAR